MKTHRCSVTLLAFTFACAVWTTNVLADSSGGYVAKLLSPSLGQVLYPGEQVSVQWKTLLPHTDARGCEMELWLSLDGGRTFTTCITPQLNPQRKSFDWTVPDMPSNAAVLDIRFGCEFYYPESFSPQPQNTFVIAHPPTLH